MVKEALISLYERDLDRLKNEILAYKKEATLWSVTDGISNSGGNLSLHICGNLQHFVGAGIGKSDYIRDRNAEFTLKNVPVTEMVTQIDATKAVVSSTISTLSSKTMETDIPEGLHRETMPVISFLLHLHAHLNYHLGQINYHRRLLDR